MSKPLTAKFQLEILGNIREAELETAEAVYNLLDGKLALSLSCVEKAIDALQRAEVILTNNRLPNSYA